MTLKVAKEIGEDFCTFDRDYLGYLDWACIYKNQKTKQVKTFRDRSCFASLPTQTGGAEYLVFFPFGRRKKNTQFNANEEAFLYYIMNDSVFSSCFHTKTSSEILKQSVILKTHLPAQLVFAAACNIRYVSEKPQIIEFWTVFREIIGDDAALIFAHMFYKENDEKYLQKNAWATQHTWLSPSNSFGKEQFKRYLSRDLTGMSNLPSFKINPSFYNVTKIWKTYIEDKVTPLEFVEGEKSESSSLNLYKFENVKNDITKMMERNCA